MGSIYSVLKELEHARTAFEEAVKIDPNYEEALYNLGVLEEKTNPTRAVDLLEKAIQIDPDYAVAHQVLGRLNQRATDLPRAEYHFRRSLEIDPSDYWSYLYLANLLAVEGKNHEAENMYRLATSLRPEISSGFTHYANFMDSIGKPQDAAGIRAK